MGYLNASFTVLTLHISQWSRSSSYNSQQQSSVACTWHLTMENTTRISVVLMWHNHNYLCLTHFLFHYYHDHYLLLVLWWPRHMTICYYSVSTAAVILPRRSRLILVTSVLLDFHKESFIITSLQAAGHVYVKIFLHTSFQNSVCT